MCRNVAIQTVGVMGARPPPDRPPMGHKRVSHSHKADEVARYGLDECSRCGADCLSAERPRVKLMVEPGKTVAVVAEMA